MERGGAAGWKAELSAAAPSALVRFTWSKKIKTRAPRLDSIPLCLNLPPYQQTARCIGKRDFLPPLCSAYPLEDDVALLVVFVGGDVKHGSAVARHDGVLHFGVLPDVQVVGFDPAHHGSQRRRLGDSQVEEACGADGQTSRWRSLWGCDRKLI